MDIALSLEEAGLSRQESIVYLNALKLGVAKASVIAKKAGIKREASYYVLASLKEKGFVSEIIKSGVKYYSAVDPRRITEMLDEEKQRKTELIFAILPELERMKKTAITTPIVEFYEGVEGFKAIVSIIVRENDHIVRGYVSGKLLHFLPSFHPQFRRKRKEHNVKMKVITEPTTQMKALRLKDKEELREMRFNMKAIHNQDSALYILSDAIIMLKADEKEQLGIYVKDKDLAQMQKSIFDLVWDISK